MKQIFDSLKKQSPSRIIALGFSAVILVGAVSALLDLLSLIPQTVLLR